MSDRANAVKEDMMDVEADMNSTKVKVKGIQDNINNDLLPKLKAMMEFDIDKIAIDVQNSGRE